MATNTPWGKSVDVRRVARGITEYQTESHGGVKLSASRYAAMPEYLRAHKPFARHLWYEEDCDWSIVALAYPEEWCRDMEPARRRATLDMARATFERMTGRTLPTA